jgi:hypothetical protein
VLLLAEVVLWCEKRSVELLGYPIAESGLSAVVGDCLRSALGIRWKETGACVSSRW